MRRALRRILAVARRDRLDRELDDEVRAHLELAERDARVAGLPPDEARLAALRQFGGIEQMKEAHRDERGAPWIESLLRDVRYAVRSMRRAPAFCAGIVLILGVAIGATTTMFSAMQAILLRPLGFGNPDALVVVLHHGSGPVSYQNFTDWRELNRSFSAMGAAEYWRANAGLTDGAERVLGVRVTPDLLPLLDVPPLLGRLFDTTDDADDDHRVVISHALWQRRFAGDPNAVGRTIGLDGMPYTIIGVMPREFAFPPFWAVGAELWAPLPSASRSTNRSANSLRVFARLKQQVSLAQARADIDAITANLDAVFPGTNRHVAVVPLKERVVGDTRLAVVVLMVGVAFVLLIACANVAHMLLVRSGARRREIAVRHALGASRTQIVRQLLVESLVLALASGLVGIAVAAAGAGVLTGLAPASLPRVSDIRVDGTVLAFTFAVSLLTGLVFGLAPAWQASRGALSDTLKIGRGTTVDREHSRMRDLLVASEIALALVLLAGAGLMVRSMSSLQSIDPGFEARRVLAFEVSTLGTPHGAPDRRLSFYRELLHRIRQLPGVQRVSAINHLPLAGDVWTRGFAIEGKPEPRPGDTPAAVYRVVFPGYFDAIGLPLIRGRDVSEQDSVGAPGVVILSDNLAREHWPGEDAIGKRIAVGAASGPDTPWLTVIGVVKDAVRNNWAEPAGYEMYLPYLQTSAYLERMESPYTYVTVVVRTHGDPASVVSLVKPTVGSFDRGVAVSNLTTMEAAIARALATPRFQLVILSLFAGVALLLAAAGIYSLMSYVVSSRTHEIGLRLTLGAQPGDVQLMILRQALARVALGAGAGLAGALLLTRLMSHLLFGVEPDDPTTLAIVTLTLSAVALLAGYVPAWRASRIDPVGALRQE